MKKLIILSLLTLITTTSFAEESTLTKFGALVMPTHQGTERLFVNINSHTWAESEEKREYLNNSYFIKAMKELRGKKIYKLQIRKSIVGDSGLDVLAQFPMIKKLDISNSKITDDGIKKIVAFCPQLVYLNVWGVTNITDQSLIYLRDLWSLEDLYLHGTQITFDAANKHRGIMQAMGAQENLTINVGDNRPTLYAFKDEELWKRTYQKNVEIGIVDETEVLKKHGQVVTNEAEYNKKYEDDLRKESTDPIFNEETP